MIYVMLSPVKLRANAYHMMDSIRLRLKDKLLESLDLTFVPLGAKSIEIWSTVCPSMIPKI